MLVLLLVFIAVLNFYILAKIEHFCCSLPWIVYGFWTIQIFFVRIIFFSELWYDWGLVFIQLSIFVFCISYIVGQYGLLRKTKRLSPVVVFRDARFHERIIQCLTVLGIISVIVFLNERGVSFSTLIKKGLFKINSELAYQRYYKDVQSSTLSSILGIIPNCLVLYTGIVQGIYGIKKRFLLLSFIPEALILITANTKSGMIAAVIFYTAGFCVGYILRFHNDFYLRRKQFLYVLFLGCVIIFLLYLSMVFRLGAFNKSNFVIAGKKFSSYAFGHIVAFDQWFRKKPQIDEYTLGRYTFYSIFDQLGIYKREQGIYHELINHAGISTNVYTIYRGFITDFSCIGTVVIHIILGFIAGRITCKIKLNKISAINVVFLILVQILYCYYVVSVLSYTTYLCMFVLLYCLLLSTNLLRGKNHWWKILKYYK